MADETAYGSGFFSDEIFAEIAPIADRYGLPEDGRAALHEAARNLGARLTWLGAQESVEGRDWGAPSQPSLLPGETVGGAGDETLAGPEPDERAGDAPGSLALPARYEDLGWLNAGGMGEIRRVRDREFNRTLAMKIIHPWLVERPTPRARFIEEAQVTAQLEHPGVVPVHAMGRLPDGRVWFTMKEIHGRTLGDVIDEVHHASRLGWSEGPGGWSFRRLVAAFHRGCEAVGYAHARGVVHRDIKPENVMVGGYGEVLVLDWGLTKLLSEAGVVTDRSRGGAQTRYGTVSGTPAYMPPEQARGEIDRLGPRADVYALGATLYQLLCGRMPYVAETGDAVVAAVVAGPPEPPRAWTRLSLPDELEAICLRAMSRDPAARYADAGALGEAVGAWLDGARKRARALELVDAADAAAPRIVDLQRQAERLRVRAAEILEPLAASAPIGDKRPGWALEDDAERLEREAERADLSRIQQLQAALTYDAELPEAHDRLASLYRERHARAEDAGDERAADRYAILLRAHDRGAHAEWLRGVGALTLYTDPPGARVGLARYVTVDRRLVPGPTRDLGPTPIRELELPVGSYLCTLQAPGRPPVRYPIRIERQACWDGAPPGRAGPAPVPIPPEADPEARYVPPGWFRMGGDPTAYFALPKGSIWVDGFFIQRHPVTNRQYIAFLDDLWARSQREDALRWAPRERATRPGEPGEPCYAQGVDGRFAPAPDAEGDVWDLDWPVFNVDWGSAAAYARWFAERTGLPWRLPAGLEWEKAARGVDGRRYPWGDHFDATRACVRDSHAGRPLPARVDAYPDDESPYGVRGTAGNVRDWCADVFETAPALGERAAVPPSDPGAPGTLRALRGGGWYYTPVSARAAGRYGFAQENRTDSLGFRLARSWPPPAEEGG